ncbi:MAG: hypothetical protein IIB76_03180 [Proteobacteria bacterium]|nr:hypothetical protein [Pseudomonadota bacterium]
MSCAGPERIIILLLLLFGLPATVVQAAVEPLFEGDTVLEVELAGPLDELIANKKRRTELPFVLTANDAQLSVNLRVRGKSRLRVCDFPPLRINFANADTQDTIFSGQGKLKLVTHCKKSDEAEKNTLEEFAAYKIFNLISDMSYRVRLLRVAYTDTDEPGKGKLLQRYGFLIESESQLAARTGGKPVRVDGLLRRSLDENQAAVVFVFQYLIGNTDWSLVTGDDEEICCHNGDLFKIGSSTHYVPYDFDLAGLVNARYAYPHPSLRIRKVTQRLYRGLCLSPELLRNALRTVSAQRDNILAVLWGTPGLLPEDIEAKVAYLTQFFIKAEDEEGLLRSFGRRCL